MEVQFERLIEPERLVQFLKAIFLIVTQLLRFKLSILVQPSNANSPTDVQLLRLIVLIPVQPLNALFPIVVQPEISTVSRAVYPVNSLFDIEVRLDMFRLFRLSLQPTKAFEPTEVQSGKLML